MFVYVSACPAPRLYITSGLTWKLYDWLITSKFQFMAFPLIQKMSVAKVTKVLPVTAK